MRAIAAVALIVACKREVPQKETVRVAADAAIITRNELACSQRFVELSRQPNREVPAYEARCARDNLQAQFRCIRAREAHLATLAGDALWRDADDSELLPEVFRRVIEAREAGATLATTERELAAAYILDAEVRNGGFQIGRAHV